MGQDASVVYLNEVSVRDTMPLWKELKLLFKNSKKHFVRDTTLFYRFTCEEKHDTIYGKFEAILKINYDDKGEVDARVCDYRFETNSRSFLDTLDLVAFHFNKFSPLNGYFLRYFKKIKLKKKLKSGYQVSYAKENDWKIIDIHQAKDTIRIYKNRKYVYKFLYRFGNKEYKFLASHIYIFYWINNYEFGLLKGERLFLKKGKGSSEVDRIFDNKKSVRVVTQFSIEMVPPPKKCCNLKINYCTIDLISYILDRQKQGKDCP